MPAPDLAASRQSAVRHFFRHLDEPHRLRRNPIAKQLLGDTLSGEVVSSQSRSVSLLLRDLIAASAAELFESGQVTGHEMVANRQALIVKRLYFDKRSVADVATELHISRRQLYRERSDICTRIVTHLTSASAPLEHQFGGIFNVGEFQLERARAVLESGHDHLAQSIYAEVRTSSEPLTAIQAACEYASIAIELGDDLGAKRGIDWATQILNRISETERRDLRACQIMLLHAKRLWACGDEKVGLTMAELALHRARAFADSSNPVARQLFVEISYAVASRRNIIGDFEVASTILRQADRLLKDVSADLRAMVEMLARVVKVNTGHDSLLETRSASVGELRLEIYKARSSGRFRMAANLSAALALKHANDGSKRSFRNEIEVVLTMADSIESPTALRDMLTFAIQGSLITQLWDQALSFANRAMEYEHPGNQKWLGMQLGRAMVHLHRGEFLEAWQIGEAAAKSADRLANYRVKGQILREMALAARALGQMAIASDCANEAVTLTESHGSIAGKFSAYLVASQISGSHKLRTRALLLARSSGESRSVRKAIESEARRCSALLACDIPRLFAE
jgi:hypothetical protein